MARPSKNKLARPRARALAVLALALASSGCGGSSGAEPGGSTVARSPQARRLIASADAICGQLNTELVSTTSSHPSNSEIASTAPRHAALEKTAVARLSRLTPPPELAGDWSKIIAYRTTLAQELEALARAAKANDTAAVSALGTSKARVHKQLAVIAVHDGFSACATVGATRRGASSEPGTSNNQNQRAPA